MSKRVYISADYSIDDGDRDVIEVLHAWGSDNKHRTDFIDTALVVSGSVSDDPDCRVCDLKKEFNKQINASSSVIFVIGDKTAKRAAGRSCRRMLDGAGCECTPYKQNTNGKVTCKWISTSTPGPNDDLGNINDYSFIEHEFKQAVRKKKSIIIVYNALNNQKGWLPSYMNDYEGHPFWKLDSNGNKVGDYQFIKQALGFE